MMCVANEPLQNVHFDPVVGCLQIVFLQFFRSDIKSDSGSYIPSQEFYRLLTEKKTCATAILDRYAITVYSKL